MVVLWDDFVLDNYRSYRRELASFGRAEIVNDVYIKVGLRFNRRMRLTLAAGAGWRDDELARLKRSVRPQQRESIGNEMPTWVIPNALARGRRPGYLGERGRPVPTSDVDKWIVEAREFGIKSIICLLSRDQLPLYDQLPGGLIAFYRSAGFAVEPVPAEDHQNPPLSDDELQKVWAAYSALPKPVLVHCSAGIDRTGLATAHIQMKLKEMAERL